MFEFVEMINKADTSTIDYQLGFHAGKESQSITECPKYGTMIDKVNWVCGWLDAGRLDAPEQIV